jgi:hypothetical protein
MKHYPFSIFLSHSSALECHDFAATDRFLEGNFVWLAGPELGTAMSYSDWRPGDPNNEGPHAVNPLPANCVRRSAGTSGTWMDAVGLAPSGQHHSLFLILSLSRPPLSGFPPFPPRSSRLFLLRARTNTHTHTHTCPISFPLLPLSTSIDIFSLNAWNGFTW